MSEPVDDEPFPPGWGIGAVGYSGGELPAEDYASELCAAGDPEHTHEEGPDDE